MDAKTKAYSEKVHAELQQTKSRLKEFEARSKGQDQQVAMDLINQLKKTHHDIEMKNEEIKNSALEEMEQEQAEIDAGLAKLRSGLTQLDAKLKTEPRRKVS